MDTTTALTHTNGTSTNGFPALTPAPAPASPAAAPGFPAPSQHRYLGTTDTIVTSSSASRHYGIGAPGNPGLLTAETSETPALHRRMASFSNSRIPNNSDTYSKCKVGNTKQILLTVNEIYQ